MKYTELNRDFAIIRKDEEASLDVGEIWGRKIAGWLNWSDLLKYHCVVLLAEALSGKTEEFRNRAEILRKEGKTAFYVRIEELADDGFEQALSLPERENFECWLNERSHEAGWFFLDSVDEARLNRKNVEKALRRFVDKFNQELGRAYVYISCRVSDWMGYDDRRMVEKFLQTRDKRVEERTEDDDVALLDPIFNQKNKKNSSTDEEESENKYHEILVVQLVPLTAEQKLILARAAGVEKPDFFIQEIEKNGLEKLSERPGDLLKFADYWNKNHCFDTLAKMIEHGIEGKLSERDKHRIDNGVLSSNKARIGAERLAAALTLAKSFTLRAPGHDLDPTLAKDAVSPDLILVDDWTDAERNALLRRGIFTPSTYGRIRFHHRDTQEYLTAKWLDRLLKNGCSLKTVWELIFAERYGVRTIVPSLRVTAAWLALSHPEICNEIIEREPLVLLQHGDPRSLSLENKKNLLLTYAARHSKGEISDDSLDHQALRMFATPDLADAIRNSWIINDREDFRLNLLRLVREGAIRACSELARSTVLNDENIGDYIRIVALEVLSVCADAEGLSVAAQWLKKSSVEVSTRIRSHFATVLFPDYLDVDDLMMLIEHSSPLQRGTLEGFDQTIGEIWRRCPNMEIREQLMAKLAEICLEKPFHDEFKKISAKHYDLAHGLVSIGRDAVLALGDNEPSDILIRLLMVIERADDPYILRENEEPSLEQLVAKNLKIQRKLFWADVEEERRFNGFYENGLIYFGQVHISKALWQVEEKNLPWLFEDMLNRNLEDDRRVALSAILSILYQSDQLNFETPRLRGLVTGKDKLEDDLERFLVPSKKLSDSENYRFKPEKYQQAPNEKERKDKESWRKFRDELKANPSQLRDPTLLANWSSGVYRLQYLTDWLESKTSKNCNRATLEWRLLEQAFGRSVAVAYRDGMKILWRITPPERPKRKSDNSITLKYTIILSFAALGIEAEDQNWVLHLSAAEVERAAQHACLSQQGCPNWIDALIERYPEIVLPILQDALHFEWSGQCRGLSDFFSHYSWMKNEIPFLVQKLILDVVIGKELKNPSILNHGLRILQHIRLDESQRRRASKLVVRRLRASKKANNDESMQRYIAILFFVDADRATDELIDFLHSMSPMPRNLRAEKLIGNLFEHNSPMVPDAFNGASVDSLERLVRCTYQYINPEDDRRHDGVYTPDDNDRASEARNAILKALLDRQGLEAYRAMRRLATELEPIGREIRFNELARGKAEYDAELQSWTPEEVLSFEQRHVAPAKTGELLLQVVMNVLSDIQASFSCADATSRPLLERAESESEVQNWLAEQMKLRSYGRFHVYRETEVACRDRPDIIVSSTSSDFEVAVEIKHGGKKWTARKLENALTSQLAEDYLKPAKRRWGVLVISNHRSRKWLHPDNQQPLNFKELIEYLKNYALKKEKNFSGAVELQVFGIDASDSKVLSDKQRKTSSKPRKVKNT